MQPFELTDLRMVLALAGTTGITGAARELDVSQQWVSKRLAAMERKLGRRLLDRSPRGTTLTVDGTLVATWAQEVVEAADRFDAAVQALSGGVSRPFRVAASLTVAEHLAPQWLAGLRQVDPDARIEITAINSAAVLERVRIRAAGLGFIETTDLPPDLESMTVSQDELVVVVPPGHPWARRSRPLPATTLARTGLVTRESGSGTRRTLEQLLSADPRITELAPPIAELSTTVGVRSAVENGVAPAVLSRVAVQDAVDRGLLRIVPLDLPLRRPLTAVWLPGSLTETGRQLLRIAGH